MSTPSFPDACPIAHDLERTTLERYILKSGSVALRGFQDFEVENIEQGIRKYEQLGRAAYACFMETLHDRTVEDMYPGSDTSKSLVRERTRSFLREENMSAILEHGFTVTGRLQGQTVNSYKEHYSEESERSVTELTNLQRARGTVDRLVLGIADLDNDRNKILEEALGLLSYNTADIDSNSVPFSTLRIASSRDYPERHFAIKTDLYLGLLQFHGPENVKKSNNPELRNRTCPALKLLPSLWDKMVEYATQNPEYYETDLAEVA